MVYQLMSLTSRVMPFEGELCFSLFMSRFFLPSHFCWETIFPVHSLSMSMHMHGCCPSHCNTLSHCRFCLLLLLASRPCLHELQRKHPQRIPLRVLLLCIPHHKLMLRRRGATLPQGVRRSTTRTSLSSVLPMLLPHLLLPHQQSLQESHQGKLH